MPYDSVIDRTDSAPLIPEEAYPEIWKSAIENSAALSLIRRIPVARGQERLAVESALPTAYFVNGDTGLKQTTEMAWKNVYLNVEEVAAIAPVPDSVIADADYDIYGEMVPRLGEAVGRAVDAAVFFGVNKPASWPTEIDAAAVAAGNTFVRGTSTVAEGGIAEDINQLMSLVEQDGYDPSGIIHDTAFKGILRGARDTQGQRLLDTTDSSVHGMSAMNTMRGLWPAGVSESEALIFDGSQMVMGLRQDLTIKVLDQAVIQDNTGAIVYNLAQQDMTAVRIVFRCGWAVPNPINYEETVEANRYPAGVLKRPAA